MSGVKHDEDKLPWHLLPSEAIEGTLAVLQFGAKKYCEGGWRSVPSAHKRYSDALMRHLLAEATGEVNDAESGLPHSAHVAWCALARLELELKPPRRLSPGVSFCP